MAESKEGKCESCDAFVMECNYPREPDFAYCGREDELDALDIPLQDKEEAGHKVRCPLWVPRDFEAERKADEALMRDLCGPLAPKGGE